MQLHFMTPLRCLSLSGLLLQLPGDEPWQLPPDLQVTRFLLYAHDRFRHCMPEGFRSLAFPTRLSPSPASSLPCQRRLHPPDRVSTCSPCCLQEPHRDEPLGIPPCARSCWPWLVLVLLASICPPPGSLLAKGSLLASPLALPLYSFCALSAPSRAASGASRVVPPSHSPSRDLSPMPRHGDSAPLRRLELA
jgi:hypothetical protein